MVPSSLTEMTEDGASESSTAVWWKGNKYLPMHDVIYDAVWINSSVDLEQIATVGWQILAREQWRLSAFIITAGREHLFK